ncbi:MAG TPA: hypothetical protein VKG25_09620 [Bryobacteraceae bacterium]|nr:hypothetical protein [Bryobacteraceae bacterium]
MRTLAVCWAALSLLGVIAAAQTQSAPAAQQPQQPQQQQQQQTPQPLFGGKIPARSSQNTKESATLGFNGIDPSGKVDKKVLAANPKPADAEKVKNMDAVRPAPADVVAFAKDGGLKTK